MLDFFMLFVLAVLPTGQAEVQNKTAEQTPVATEAPVVVDTTNTLNETSIMTDEKLLQAGAVKDDETVAIIHTNHGDITLRFFPEAAPKTVENFTGLAKKGYYDGVIFHRIIDGFMIQGGDPEGTGRGGESVWGGSFEDEFSDTAKNNIGSISMANSGPATNGSQFFINTANNNFLDNRHAVFGEVISGMNIVNAVSKVKTNASDRPTSDVVMKNIEILTFAEFKAK